VCDLRLWYNFHFQQFCILLIQESAHALMHMLAGHALSGELSVEIYINGYPKGINYHQSVAFIGKNDAIIESLTVFQALFFEATCATDLTVERRIAQNIKEQQRRVVSVLNLLQMNSMANRRVREFKQPFQRRRIQLAMALVTNPSLLFLDNFFEGLSGSDALLLTIQLNQLADEGRTVVCHLNDPREEMLALFNTILLLHNGQSAFFGSLDSFKTFSCRHGYVDKP